MKSRLTIAIDGPAGAGKSTVAKLLAKELGLTYIDTGAMYRAIALLAIESGLTADDAECLTEIAEKADLKLTFANGEMRVILNDKDVSSRIRMPDVTALVSPLSVHSGVRAALVQKQREMAAAGGIILDGRDIGTVVLPDADYKFFLTASVSERASRRMKDLEAIGQSVDYAQLLKEIEERDFRDSNRQVAPLKQAEDAVLIDSDKLNLQEVVQSMLNAIRQ